MEDLYKALIGMERDEADDLAARLEKFITGSFRGIFDQASNIDIKSQFTVFSVKEMEEELRPIAMYVILDFIWTRIKKDLKKRILVIDEAWYFMMHPDSASFVYSMVKRARKYYLGITTITQDVEDFLRSDYGKAIVSNASIQFLMKQSTASIPILTQTFYLSEGERQLLVSADIGEGVFFAGQNHVALRVIASPDEHQVITTNPEEIVRRREEKKEAQMMEVQTQKQESFEKTQKNRELRRQRLENKQEFQREKPQDDRLFRPAATADVDLSQDPLKGASDKADKQLRNENNRFNAENELSKREKAGEDNNKENLPKLKTIFGEEEKKLKPDQHGVYSIDDYQVPN
jgi:hypothetical protein